MSGIDESWEENDDSGDGRSGHDNDDGQDPYEAEQLVLDDQDERLPWLESDDVDEYADGPDLGRMFGMALLGLVALAAIVGGIWWSTHRRPDAALIADGGTIKAPAGPYKEAPKEPGGKTFEGTGDTAFAVSEGQSHAAKLGEAGPPKPSVDLSPKPPVPPSAKASTPAAAHAPASQAPAALAAAPAAGTLVQVGAYSNRALAEAAWSRLSGQYDALSGQRHQIVEGQADIGTVFRLQALPGDGDAARSLCGKLKASGLACQVK
jgi:SPOR domain